MATTTWSLEEAQRITAEILTEIMPRPARYRYWTRDGRRYHYTTERVNGKFWAQELRPVGAGSRTGKASQWREVRRVGFRTRKAAKARAYAWYGAAAEGKEETR